MTRIGTILWTKPVFIPFEKKSIMEQSKNGQPPPQTGKEIENANSNEQGRQQPAEKTNDISHVDQQEGQMQNGELGGNFNEPESRSESA